MEFDEAVEYAARELRHGSTRPRVRRELVDFSMAPEEASKVLNLADQIVSSERRSAGAVVARWQMVVGALLAVGGAGLAFWSYHAAEPGQYYMIPTGLIGLGAYLFFRGKMRV